MPSLFTQIIQGKIPCHRLAEDERFLAFLDIRPITLGHALVIPKQEVDYIFDLEDTLLGDLMAFAKPVAKAIERVVPCQRIGVMVAGLEVPHAHVHLVPIQAVSDLNFAHAKAAESSHLEKLCLQIVAQFQASV